MRFIRFGSWIVALFTAMTIVGAGIHSAFNFIMPTLGIDGNMAQAGGYTMELVVAGVAFVMVLWRLLWALEIVETFDEVVRLMRTRPAVLSVGLAGLIFMDAANRFYWWQKHMFTDEAFNSVSSYTGAANSVIVAFVMCVLVYSLHKRPDDIDETIMVYQKTKFPLGLPTALVMWSVGWIGFWIGCFAYVNQY